jgi:uncharacterized protein (TIGR03067 family)
MRRLAFLIGACVLLVPAGRADDKAAGDDKEKIQGTWTLVSGQHNGNPIPEEDAKTIKITFTADKLMLKHGDQEREFSYKLYPDRKPKAIDVDMDGKIGKGIYELDGDKLKIAHGEVNEPRPKAFPKKGEESKLSYVVLKRVKS